MSDQKQHGPAADEAAQRLVRAFDDSLAAAEAEAPAFEDVAAYVEGRLDDEERLLFEERLAGDSLLRAEVEDLRELRAEMARPARPAGSRTWLAAAAVLVAAAAMAWLWLRPAALPQARRAGQTPAPAATPATLVRLADQGGEVALLADGTLRGVPPALAASVRDALRSGSVHVPPLRDDLAVSSVTAMGEAEAAAPFGPTAPRSTLVTSDRPTFRWSRHPRARAYVVSVYDLELEPVAESPRLTATEWAPDRPLPRGRTYVWQVEAFTTGGREVAPAPPAPEARVHIASAEAVDAVRQALAAAAGSHLAAGLALAEGGFLDEASGQLESLAALNPGSSEVARLRETLAAARR